MRLQLRFCHLVEPQDCQDTDRSLNAVQDIDDCIACVIVLARLTEDSSDYPLRDGEDYATGEDLEDGKPRFLYKLGSRSRPEKRIRTA
jgi:hypothetical protein